MNSEAVLLEEVKKLNSTIADLEAKNSSLRELNSSLEKLNGWYIEQFKLLQKKKFGRSSEKDSDDQFSFFDLFNESETLKEPIVIEPKEDEILVSSYKKRKRKRGENFSGLPVETIEYKLEDEDKVCDNCASPLTDMKKEVRKELVIIPAQVKVVEHVTHVYSCRACDKEGISGFIKAANSPKALIPKSMVSPSLLAHLQHEKYVMATPFYRQEGNYARLGINLSRQNLSNWDMAGAKILRPLYELIKKELLSHELLHADETVLEVIHEPGRETKGKSYMWLYRTSNDTNHPVVMYDYQMGRSGDYAKTFLKDWQGKYLHCDGYGGYKKLQDVTLCGCLVHAKRKFHEAFIAGQSNENAKIGESYIKQLFAIEKIADNNNYSYEERLALRQDKSQKVINEFYSWINEVSLKTLPQSLLGKAITYAVNQKEYLCAFLKDGRIQLSNNLAEQSIRMFVIGRKNWIFSNTANGATSSALIYSIVQTAIANNLKPEHYLRYVYEQIQLQKDLKLENLLPWSDKIPGEYKNKNI